MWQLPALWHTGTSGRDYPLQYAMTQGRRHPVRAPKPSGQVYARHIPWLDQVFSMRVADLDADLACFHGWMNDPRVAAFWEEEGDLEKHRDYLSAQLADPHTIPLIGCLDGKPFAYFEVYWAKENRIGPYYDADDFDRGWHVLIGDGAIRGKAYISAWLPSLMHYMFLDDPRTQRIVGEPRIDHVQQIRNLDRSGFAKVKAFDFPHKRAMLVMLLRERFFGERLWVPQDDGQAQLSGAEPTALAA
ncbi:N(6)-hydroxylysine O-acetyltransferase [compost metagenome]